MHEIFSLLDSTSGVSLSLVAWHGNNAVDWLAARKMIQHDWLEFVPFSLSNILIQDSELAKNNCTSSNGVNTRDGIG